MVEVTVPKLPSPDPTSGKAKRWWFAALNISARTCSSLPSLDGELFRKRKIHVANPVSAQIRKMPWRVARNVVSWIGEAVLVQVWGSCLGRLVIIDSSRKLRAHHVRSLVSVRQPGVAVDDRNRLPALYRQESIQRPAADDRIRHVAHAAANPAPAPHRQINDKGRCEPVSGVIRTDAMLGLQIVQQLRVVEFQIGQPRISSREQNRRSTSRMCSSPRS